MRTGAPFRDRTRARRRRRRLTDGGRSWCLTGVDYFSTLGYQPGIARARRRRDLARSRPLVLGGADPARCAAGLPAGGSRGPNGEGSIAMLERLMSFWKGKIFVLVLLGFAAYRLHHHHDAVRRRRHRSPWSENPVSSHFSAAIRSAHHV